jgi:peptide/nickel transport system ATP-binding protein
MTASSPLLSLSGVAALTPSGRSIFRNTNLTIGTGDIVGITGPSGCGKSTLLTWAANAQQSAARVTAESIIRPEVSTGEPSRPSIGYVPQGSQNLFVPQFATNATIRLLLGALPVQYRDQLLARMDQLLNAFALSPNHVRRSSVKSLSGGETQRLALALTLAREPFLWIADEPTASLDAANKRRLIEFLNGARADRKIAMLIASHDRDFLRAVCDSVLVLGPAGLTPDTGAGTIEVSKPHVKNVGNPVVSLHNVSHSYKTGFTPRWIIRDFSAEFSSSMVYGIVGPSGIGKSTLLRLIAGFERPTRGRVRRFDGPDTSRPQTLLVPQETRQFFNPVQSLGAFARTLAAGQSRLPSFDQLAPVMNALKVDKALLRQLPNAPSGGEMQRLALAISIWLKPKLLCLDEIDSALDVPNKSLAAEHVVNLARAENVVVILATHDLGFAKATCDVVIQADDDRAFIS